MTYIQHAKRQFYTFSVFVFAFCASRYVVLFFGGEPTAVPAASVFFGAAIGWILLGPLVKMWVNRGKYRPSRKKRHTGYSSSFE